MNRFRFTDEFIKTIKQHLDDELNYLPFIRRYKPKEKKDGYLYVDEKKIIPQSEVKKYLQRVTKTTAAPMGIQTLRHYLSSRVIGVTRSMIADFLRKHSDLQSIVKRPPTKRTERKSLPKEGTTDFILKQYPNTIGTDLIKITNKTFHPGYRGKTGNYIMVSVHKQTGYVWTDLLNNSKATNTLPEMKRVIADCKEKFGSKGLHVESDSGKEYFSVFEDWLEKEDIKQTRLRLVSYVERANSQLQRTMKFLSYDHPIAMNLDLSTKKMNNTKNRMTGKAPIEWVGKKDNRVVDRVHKGNKSLGHRKWMGSRHKKKTFKIGDMVNHLVKKVARTKGVLYKSYEGDQWSEPKEILKKHAGKYWILDKVSKAQLDREAAGAKKKKRKGWWYPSEDLKHAYVEVKKPKPKAPVPEVVPKRRKLRSQRGEIVKALAKNKQRSGIVKADWKIDNKKFKKAVYKPKKKKRKKGVNWYPGKEVDLTMDTDSDENPFKPNYGVGSGSLADFLGL